MASEVETMAFKGETPWHGLGVKVDRTLQPQEMLKAAGLDWKVEKRPLTIALDNGLAAGQVLNDTAALVRDSDQKILGICGKEYTPMQNEETFKFFEKFCKAGDMEMDTAGSLCGGKRVWGLAKIKGGFTLKGGDEVEGYMLLNSPHIWGKSMSIMFSPIRVVCMNTLTMALNKSSDENTFRMIHNRAFDAAAIKMAEEKLGLAMKELDKFKKAAQLLSSKKADDEAVQRFMAKIFQPDLLKDQVILPDQYNRRMEKLMELVATQPGADLKSSKGTWWGAFNAATYYIDHIAGRDQDARLERAWFGSSATLKRNALNDALELAK